MRSPAPTAPIPGSRARSEIERSAPAGAPETRSPRPPEGERSGERHRPTLSTIPMIRSCRLAASERGERVVEALAGHAEPDRRLTPRSIEHLFKIGGLLCSAMRTSRVLGPYSSAAAASRTPIVAFRHEPSFHHRNRRHRRHHNPRSPRGRSNRSRSIRHRPPMSSPLKGEEWKQAARSARRANSN